MKLQDFSNVLAIAEQGSLRAAARHLQIGQPALTRSLGELERELGTPLFERQTRGMALTPVGEAFVQRATLILHEVRRTREEVEQLRGGTGGSVVVGLSIAAHFAILPRLLAPFRTRYPAVRLQIIEGLYPTLEAGLRSGEVDFYAGPQPERPVSGNLLQEHLFANTRVIIGRRGHPLTGATSLHGLVEAQWATTSVTIRPDQELGRLFERHRLPPPHLAIQSQTALTLLICLASSDLLAMVPVQWLTFGDAGGSLQAIPVSEALPAPSIVLVRKAGLPLTPAAALLADLVRSAAAAEGSARLPHAAKKVTARPGRRP